MSVQSLPVMEQLQRMLRQLRQDYVYMLSGTQAPPVTERSAVNERYGFQFPEGSYFAAELRAAPGTPAAETARTAEKLLQALSVLPGDAECLLQAHGFLCICGTTAGCAEFSSVLYAFFDRLPHSGAGCLWTMGIGAYTRDFSVLQGVVTSAQHARKQSIVYGTGKIYDGNRQDVIYTGAVELVTQDEKLRLQQLFLERRTAELSPFLSGLFAAREGEIRKYPVVACMLSIHILQLTMQTLRENMAVDRETFEISLQYENTVDDNETVEALIAHTTAGVEAMCHRYELYIANGNSRPVWTAMSYIQEHYAEKLTLQELAAKADRNPQYLSTLFSRECGMSIREYIAATRMEHAKCLLRTTDLRVGEIGEQVGYPDPQYFSRVFYRSAGLWPLEYRTRQRSGQSPEEDG